MENNMNENKCAGGMCGGKGSCGCGHHHMHIMKWLLKIALLIVVFCFAFQMGELKGMLRSQGYGHRIYSNMMYGTDVSNGIVPETGVSVGGTTAPAAPAAK